MGTALTTWTRGKTRLRIAVEDELFVALALFLVAAVSAKKHEIKIKQTCKQPVVAIQDLWDEHVGHVGKGAVLHFDLDTDMETQHFDPFDQVLTLKVYKWVVFGYVKVPDPVLRLVCNQIAKDLPHGKITCNKDGKVLVHCLLQDVTGHCLPVKGQSHLILPLTTSYLETIANSKEVQETVPNLFSGKVKVKVDVTSATLHGEILCNEVELSIKL